MTDGAIGGYFELELPQLKSEIYKDAYRFQSARAAFYALLLTGAPQKVWMPRYLCDSMFAALDKANIEYELYSINESFEILDDFVLGAGEWLLYVNYFGVCGAQQQSILHKYNPSQVIFDHSQALFAPPLNCLATIYSPRKFLGLPDGGLLITALAIEEVVDRDQGSLSRTNHLLKRLADAPEVGYGDFQVAEKSLENISLLKMSHLTSQLLSSVNFSDVKNRRNYNFRLLHERLGWINELTIDLENIDGPLCYPFIHKAAPVLRSTLLQSRVFVSTYWPDVKLRAEIASAEIKFMNTLLPLPCDQRYRENDILRIIKLIEGQQ